MQAFTLDLLHPLAKLLPGQKPGSTDYLNYCWTALGAEKTAIQIAVCFNWQQGQPVRRTLNLRINSPVSRYLKLYEVKLVPSELPAYPFHDANYLTVTPGLLPDLLREATKAPTDGKADSRIWQITLPADRVMLYWLEACLPVELAGEQPLEISLVAEDDILQDRKTTSLTILTAELPAQSLLRTEWFHADCLADYYGVEVFSEAHWEIIGNFMQMAGEHGINMILTPLFTPPLDTAIGSERPTVQLVDVTLENGRYLFDFPKLKRWLDLAQSRGLKFFEMSHLFTQWGAKAAPKIMAWQDGALRRIFGWDTPAAGREYKEFLAAFLPQLVCFLETNGIADRCYFHISDEPSHEDIPAYKAARDMVRPHIKDMPIIDALSDLSFYKTGIVEKPIPASDHIEPFLAEKVPGLWTYYCCGQAVDVANCFMAMPAARVRVLGIQLFKFDIEGFLHWGYNFYNSQHSLQRIDPYSNTDSLGAFPSGDAFLVYPGKGSKPEPSLRLKLLDQAMSDLRALRLLEKLTSRQYVLDLLEEGLAKPLTFSEYPHDAAWLLSLRRKINDELRKYPVV